MKLSLYTPPFSHITSYFEMVDIASEYNLALETINYLELSEPDMDFAKHLREYADIKGVAISCVSVAKHLVGDDAREKIETVKKFVEIAHILGAPYLHHTIALYNYTPEELKNDKELYIERGIKAIEEIYEYAQKYNITTLHEDQGFIFNGKEGLGLIKNRAKCNSKICADFGNILFVDEAIEDVIPTISDRIVNVHVKDYKPYIKTADGKESDDISISGKIYEACSLGEGVVNFDKGFEELKKIAYDGYVALECIPVGNEQETFEKNIAFLNKYISNS